MTGLIMRLMGHKMMHKTIANHTGNGGPFDMKLGFALFRDRRVPVASKAMALALGSGAIAAMMTLEIPLESLLALFLPILGMAADVTLDGIEVVAGPVILASLLLPRIAPAEVVEIVRQERLVSLMQPVGIIG